MKLPQVRHWVHIAIGASVPWVGWLLSTKGLPSLALIICLGLLGLFCVYEDDSYLDIYETTIALGISTVVLVSYIMST